MATVIPFPTPSLGGFRLQEIVRGSGKGVITVWLSSYGDARARFRIRVRHLRGTPRPWPKTQFRPLGKGVFEIKWKAGTKEFRALGFDRGDYFVMVIGCTHKQAVYDPHDCLNTANRRKSEVERGEWRIIDFEP